jgi:quinol-cytochrome oxidoreductase complex cytochrome b subunit
LIAVVVLHLLRVYFTGAFHTARRFNWVIGLALLLCVLVSNFTGYLLPWDQLSFWAITICTRMIGYVPLVGEWLQEIIRGGPEIGSATLINFYTFHTTVIPILLIVFMAFHFWRVRKAHGVVVPRSPGENADEKPEYVLTLPHLLLREVAVALVLIALTMVVALVFNAPLADAANPGMSPNPAKAPWYFVGFQELQLHFHPILAVVIIPLAVLIGLLLIPYLSYDSSESGVFLFSLKGRRMGKVAALTGLVVAPLWVVLDELWIDLMAWLPGLPPAVSNGVLPAVVLTVVFYGYYTRMKKKYSANNNETIQASFILISVIFIVLTITGVWFRGAGMALVWPWNL